jgi:hypothetical protein
MVSRDVAALFMEHMPDDEIRRLRDSIAKAEAEITAPMWERHRELHGRIEELKVLYSSDEVPEALRRAFDEARES